MNQFLDNVAEALKNPEAIIFAIAGLLFYPVLFAEIGAVIWVVFESGRCSIEAWRRRGTTDTKGLDAAIASTAALAQPRERVATMSTKQVSPVVSAALAALAAAPVLDRASTLRALDDLEYQLRRKLDRTRVFIRVGPILGLMGTLIPISPALVAMAEGNIQVLSNNLRIAFGATVVGLLIGGLGYIVSATRDRWYNRDIQDLEYILDRMGL